MRKDYKEFVQCDCGSEYIVFEPQDLDCLDEGLYMSVFTVAYDKPSFWHRFRHIWHTLKTGKPYTDQVCLDLDKVKELNKYLTNFITLAELEKKHFKKPKKKVNLEIAVSDTEPLYIDKTLLKKVKIKKK